MSIQAADSLDREEHEETRKLVVSAFALASSLGIKTLVVQAGEISDVRLVKGLRVDERVIRIACDRKQIPHFDPSKDIVLDMPDAALNRLSQLNLALLSRRSQPSLRPR